MKSNDDLIAIRKGLKRVALAWHPSVWMKTPFPMLNNVIGHADKGLAYGRMIEISGWESAGKSAITLTIAALAQRDGAHIIWGDIENSFESDWALQRGFIKCPTCNGKNYGQCVGCGYDPSEPGSEGCGLDITRVTLIQPYVGTFEGEKSPRLSTAQELCSEIEACMKLKRKEDRYFVVLDSIAALETEEERKAGIEGANMRTNMALSMLLGRLLRRWVGLAQVHNAAIILVNQLRSGPKAFGDPTYAPGGNAPRFYSHVRLRVKRVMGSKIIDKGKTIGIRGIIEAKKNKTGGEEGAKVGFRLLFRGKVEFVKASEVAKDKDSE
jgi:RecA/RadA recombinase